MSRRASKKREARYLIPLFAGSLPLLYLGTTHQSSKLALLGTSVALVASWLMKQTDDHLRASAQAFLTRDDFQY